jgi:HK97 family phage prohead protease
MEQFQFSGVASYAGNVDLHGEVVAAGAFKRTLDLKGPVRPLLWAHDMHSPIGYVTLTDSDRELIAQGTILTGVQRGAEAKLLIESGSINGLSIGYRVIKDAAGEGSKRVLQEVDLFEVSVVVVPANPRARIRGKAAAELTGSLRRLQGSISGPAHPENNDLRCVLSALEDLRRAMRA